MAGMYSYKNFFQNLYRSLGQEYGFRAQTTEEMEQWKQEFRQALKKTLGLDMLEKIVNQWKLPESGNWPVEQLECVKEGGYIRYKFRMETLPQVYMPFYMLVPENVSAQEPGRAVIAVPAHGANKDTVAGVPAGRTVREKLSRTPKEAYGLALVKRGYVVLCPDPPGYGERIEPPSTEDSAFKQPSLRGANEEGADPEVRDRKASDLDTEGLNPLGSSCKDLSQTAEAFGMSLTALEIWDLMRLVDFSLSRKEIDGKRIGCIGFSGGGQYAMWLAAMDERVHAAVVSGYVHGYYDSILDVHLCPCNYAPRLWRLGDISDICSLIAPRPLFVENGLSDPLNGYRGIAGPKEQVERMRMAYRLYGQEENLVHVTPEGGHQWYGECYDFLDRVFA